MCMSAHFTIHMMAKSSCFNYIQVYHSRPHPRDKVRFYVSLKPRLEEKDKYKLNISSHKNKKLTKQ